MQISKTHVLANNGGSSSIKFALFECPQPMNQMLSDAIDRIGLKNAYFHVTGQTEAEGFSRSVPAPDHSAAAALLMNWIEE